MKLFKAANVGLKYAPFDANCFAVLCRLIENKT